MFAAAYRCVMAFAVAPHSARMFASLPAALLTALSWLLLARLASAHQAIAYPWPISNDGACRVGLFKNCAGPCPTGDLRLDQTRDSPSLTLRRGDSVYVHVKRNNHAGGFTRWSIVHVADMYDKRKHEQGAFYFTCGDQHSTFCGATNRLRDCTYDGRNQYYRHKLTIPRIYADGVYVLGFAWFGGTQAHGRGGVFGDYYDCMYVHIKGGALQKWHQPTFDTGASATGTDKLCRARTTWLGDCRKEPCTHRKSGLRVPWQFANGNKPKRLHSSAFRAPYTIRKVGKRAPRVEAIVIREARRPSRVYASSKWAPTAKLSLSKSAQMTVTCDVSGDVRHVIFYRNGIGVRKESSAPFSIAGTYGERVKGRRLRRFRAWQVARTNDFYSLACAVYGNDGSVQYAKMDVEQSV
eukprot:TRINITY_DN0_c2_g1_i1.p2 TRINITY_DN0_c2_g1~~TRINITY_DN0_c2_g1_i1.p2  ORF type:complete len:409 (+),score=70.75 TRINITY_DN0_c2_g1_i1:191-1417(+)